MKLMMSGISAVLLSLLLIGCTTSSQLNNVHIGMSKDQVISLMGKPDSTSAQANIEYLTYYLSNDGSYRDQPYSVRLVDGKVESFGRLTQLFDIYSRPVASGGVGSPVNVPWNNGIGPYGYGTLPPQIHINGHDVVTQLERLKSLKDQGVVSEEEYQKIKAKLMENVK